MRALVTGAGGFVGGHLCTELARNGAKILKVERKAGIESDTISLDVSDTEALTQLISDNKIEVIHHLAGIAFVPQCEEDFSLAMNGNVVTTYSVCKAIVAASKERAARAKMILISSGEVYGRVYPNQLPVNETEPALPQNNYSLSKSMAENVAARLSDRFGFDLVIFRPFNHIGPGQDDRFVVSSFARQIAKIKHGKQDRIIKVGNLSAKRDFTDVRDIVNGYCLGASRGAGIYNLCSGTAISISSILEQLIVISGVNCEVQVDPERVRPLEVLEIRGSNHRAKYDLVWSPKIPISDSLKDVFQYWDKVEAGA